VRQMQASIGDRSGYLQSLFKWRAKKEGLVLHSRTGEKWSKMSIKNQRERNARDDIRVGLRRRKQKPSLRGTRGRDVCSRGGGKTRLKKPMEERRGGGELLGRVAYH